jgi:flagellar motor protein MotB
MAKKFLVALALGVCVAAATGCATADLQVKVDELTREKEDLQRQNAQFAADALTWKAKFDALERGRTAPKAGVTPTPFDMPPELQGKVDILRRGNETVIAIPTDVFFSSGSSNLTRDSEKTMGHVADFIKKNRSAGMIRVEGHADTDPIRRTRTKYHCNWELSFERSHAVMHFLVEKGKFDPHHVVCESYGEFQPADPGNKARNRRVEIVIAQ